MTVFDAKAAAMVLAHYGGERTALARDLKSQFPDLSQEQALALIDEATEKLRVRDAELDRLADAEAVDAEHDLDKTMHERGD